MRWLIQDYFDQQVQLDGKQRRAAYRRANGYFRANKRHVCTYLAVTLAPTLLMWVWILFGHELVGRPSRVVRLLYGPALLVCTYLAHACVLRHVYAPHVRRAVREFGYNLCLSCGYWLRGLTADIKRCPECGTHIRI